MLNPTLSKIEIVRGMFQVGTSHITNASNGQPTAATEPGVMRHQGVIMQLAKFKEDYWQLRNGEECHKEHPETFWIPSLEERQNLKVGDAAKVIFEIECETEDGEIIIEGERGYLIVSEVIEDKYIGILDFQPLCIDKEDDDVYLQFGAEIPFSTEHVIDIDRPPEDYIKWQLSMKPERVWYRK
ncbi:hypothetical protein NX722_08455 [Endozoicomonas gorgoniicola]|uniref:ASCH domain-containing protein n=1 Tax=Endozoicomonas gorgoniicola TaxID=1234144 RepID=A0ABT3MUL7_9GAMM|nr:hypothetical protein [Endozoicomonas gorgoniicola]MCW7552674.1 hypothetical protein [Endozoicomonas gorgoniicola]